MQYESVWKCKVKEYPTQYTSIFYTTLTQKTALHAYLNRFKWKYAENVPSATFLQLNELKTVVKPS